MSAENIADDSKGPDAEVAATATRRFYPKTHANYWKSRLEHRSYSRDGNTFEVAEWSVRIHFRGLRKSFDLETANKEEAAAKARDIYLSLVAKGWSATVKRAKELETKVGAHFEREERYQQLTRRQSEIEEKLDLTKNQAPSQVDADSSEETAQKISEKQTKTHSPRPARRAAVRV